MQFYRKLNKIKALTFDLDDTLYDNRPVIENLEIKLREWLCVAHPVSGTQSVDWWSDLKQELVFASPLLAQDVSHWRFCQIKQGLMRLGYQEVDADNAAKEAMVVTRQLRNQIVIPSMTFDVLGELAQRLPLIGITNGNVDPQAIGLEKYFNSVLFAQKDGAAKPHADLFIKASQLLKVPLAHTLHVGDSLNADVKGALTAGAMACWYNDISSTALDKSEHEFLPHLEISALDDLLLLPYDF